MCLGLNDADHDSLVRYLNDPVFAPTSVRTDDAPQGGLPEDASNDAEPQWLSGPALAERAT